MIGQFSKEEIEAAKVKASAQVRKLIEARKKLDKETNLTINLKDEYMKTHNYKEMLQILENIFARLTDPVIKRFYNDSSAEDAIVKLVIEYESDGKYDDRKKAEAALVFDAFAGALGIKEKVIKMHSEIIRGRVKS